MANPPRSRPRANQGSLLERFLVLRARLKGPRESRRRRRWRLLKDAFREG